MKIRNAFIEKPEPKLKPELDADIERARVLTARLALRRPRSDQTMADYAAKARRLSALAGVDDLLDERLIGTVERKGRARSSFEAYRAALIANVDKELRSALANLTKLQATPNVDNEIERERRRIAAGVKILDHYQPDLDGNFSIRDWAAKPEHERKRTLWPGPTASYDVEERRTNDKRADLGRFRRRVDGWLDRYWKRAQGSAYCPLVALAMTTGCRPVEMVVHPVREMNGVRVWVEHGRLNFDIPAGKLSVMRAVFDPTAVALVNRLCAVTGAKIVVHSNWRKTVGLDETRGKLIEQGIEESHLHEAWATPRRGLHRDEKRAEITGWLLENRLTPDPAPRPPIEDREAHARWEDAKYDTGHDVVVIDDEDLGDGFMTRTTAVPVDYQEGMSFAAYRLAMGLWWAEDRAMGVYHVADVDWRRVVEAFGGNRRHAAEWLHTPDHWGRTQARMLLGEVDRDAALAYAYRGEDPPSADDMRRQVWAELERTVADRAPSLEATEPQDPDVAEEFGVDHRWSIALKARAAQLRWPEAIDHLLAAMAADGRKVENHYPPGFDLSHLRGLDGSEVTVLDLARVGRPWGLVPGLVPRQRVDVD